MTKDLLVCVDGGGTKTEAVLADLKGNILRIARSGGSNPLTVGEETAVNNVQSVFCRVVPRALAERVHSGWLFIPGFRHCPPLELGYSVTVMGDEESAYFGALGASDGIVVLAGTGSFAAHYDSMGHMTRAGGWGHMLGDEGSGFDIGRRAVRKVLQDYDEGRPASPLSQAVCRHYGVEQCRTLVGAIYRSGCSRERMAQLCPLVGELAAKGDAPSLVIVQDAAKALSNLAVTVKTRLRLSHIPVALIGGVSGLGEVLLSSFRKNVQDQGMAYMLPKYSPTVGGVLYAYMKTQGLPASSNIADAYYYSYLQLKEGQSHADGCIL